MKRKKENEIVGRKLMLVSLWDPAEAITAHYHALNQKRAQTYAAQV